MLNLNYCFECSYRCKLPKTLPKSILQITQANQKTNPSWSRLIDKTIDQRFKRNESHDPKGIKNYDPKGPDM